MDVDYITLRSLTESLKSLRLADVPGKNVGTAVSYLKGALLLLKKCNAVPTNSMGLLNNVMNSTDCNYFTNYMKMMYFA